MNDALHLRKARDMWPILAARARTRKLPLFYGQLAAPFGVHPRNARYPLGIIQDYCEKHKLPRLQALAVNAKTKRPGPGYKGTDHAGDLTAVYDHGNQWPLQCPF